MTEKETGGPEDEPRPRRRAWPRRALRALVVLLLVLFVPALAGLVLLQLPVGRTAVQAFVERTVGRAVDGRLALGTLDYDLVRGRVDATNVALDMEGISLRLERGEVRAGPWQGVRLRLVRPVLVLRDTGEPEKKEAATGIAARPWSVLEKLRSAEVVDGRIEVQDAKGAAYAVVGRLDASMREANGTRPIRLTVGDGVVGAPGSAVRLRAVRGEARLAVGGSRLRIESVAVSVNGSSVGASGVIERLSPSEGDLVLHASVDGALAASLSPATRMTGRAEAEAIVKLAGDDVTGTVRLTTPSGITAQGVGPWVAAARGRFDSRQLVVESAEVSGYSARITGQGRVAIDGESRTDLQLRVDPLDVGTVARAAANADVPVRATLDGSLRYTTKGLDLDAGRATGSIRVRPTPLAVGRRPRRGEAPGVPLEGATEVAVEGRRVRLWNLRLEAHRARVVGELGLDAGVLDGRFEATLPLESVGALAADVAAASTPPELAGTLTASGTIGGPAGDPVVSFQFAGSGLAPAATSSRATVAVDGAARYARGRVRIEPLSVRSGDGEAVLEGGIPTAATGGDWDVRGDVRALDLGPLLALAGVEGRGPLNGQLRVQGPYAKPSARADLDARVSLAGDAEALAVSATATLADGRLGVERLVADVAGGRVEAAGSYDTATRAMTAKGTAAGLRVGHLPQRPSSMPPVDGRLGATFDLSGRPDAPVGSARVTVDQVTHDGRPLPDFALAARADGARLELTGSSTRAAASSPPAGSDDARGESVFLRGGGTFDGAWPVRFQLDLAALPVQALLVAFPAAKDAAIEARGTIAVDLAARDPRRLHYTGEGLALSGKVRELEWSTEPFRVEGGREEATITGLRLSTRTSARVVDPSRRDDARAAGGEATPSPVGGTLAVDGRVPIAADRTFDLTIDGGLDLAALQAVSPEDRATGVATVRAQVRGTLEAPDARGTFGVTGGRGRFGGARVNQLEVAGRLEGSEAFLDQASARVLGGTLTAGGSFPLAPLGAGRAARLRFEAKDVDLSRMAISYADRTPDAPSFFVSASGEVTATAPRLDAVRAEGRFTRLESTSSEGSIALVAPAAWRLENGRFEQDPIRLAGPLGTLEARAEARLGDEAGGSAVVAGPFDLRMLGPFVPDTTLAGDARVDVRASWTSKGARIEGGLFVDDGRLTLEALQFTASRIEGEVRFSGDRATLRATGAAGEGTLVANGAMTFGPGLLGPADLTLEAQRIPIGYPEGFRGRASGTIRVAGEPGSYGVIGDVAVNQAYYTAEFDQRGQSLDRLDYQLAAIRGETSITESLPLRVSVRLADPLRIRNSQAQLDVVGTLAVGGTLAQPVTTGQVSLLEGGQVTVRRARIRPQEGRVELNGYPSGVPEIDFTGMTQVGGVAMSLRAQGSIEDLQLDVASPNRPDLSRTDLISLLLTGRTAQAAASQSGAIVAEELAAALGGALQKGVGESFLIDVSSDQSLLLDESDPAQRFNVGTRLRQDLSVIYSTRLDGTEQRWVVEWNPSGGRFRIRGIDDRDQGYAVELTDRVAFDLFRRRLPSPVEKTKERRKLGSLRLDGTLPLPEKELLDAAGLKVGRRYDPPRLEQAADEVRAKLVERGWRAASVDAISEPVAGHEKTRVGLVLRVASGPHVAVSWTGDDPGGKLREDAVAAWPAYASPDAAAAAVARALRVALQAQGFYDAKVEHAVKTQGDQAEVGFAVTRGPKGSRVEVAFEGNSALTDARLAATMPRPGSHAFFEALDRPSRLTAEARIAYANAGHLRARVGPPRPRFDPLTGVLTVTVPVRERGASRIAKVDLPPEVAGAGGAAPALQLRAGQPFDVEAYLADRDAIAAWYRREGWMEARVRGVLRPQGDDVDVAFAVEPGPRPRLADVRIASKGRTREAMVRRQVEVEPGAIIRPQELSQTRARLSEMDVFTSVDVRPVPVEGRPDARDLVVSYVERPDVTVEYGVRYDFSGSSGSGGAASSPSQGKFQVAAGFELANPLGWGWRLKGYTLQTTNLHNYRFGMESSTLLGVRLRTQLLYFDETDNESLIAASYASKVRGYSIQQTRTLLRDTDSRRWHDRLRLQWGYTNKDIQYSEDVGSDVLVAGNRAFLSLSLIGDWRDSLTDPRRGLFWTATSEFSRTFLGSDVNYVRLYGQLFAYVPVAKRIVWAQGYRAGVVPGDDPFYLLENRFQSGGPTTVRGFRQNGLGPQFDESEGFGGQGVFVLNQELRFPIWRQLHGGVFWDAGNTWLLASEFSLRDLRHTVGGGLRFMLPFGPIRVEYGFVLDRRKNSDGTYVEPLGRLVFGLGHAF